MNESDDTPFDPLLNPDAPSSDVEVMPVEEPRRAASLTLRSDEVREARLVSMEAANKSLAEALKITYRALQLVMIALVVLFAFSGFEQINQSESGIRVDLGKIKSERLNPGFEFAPPYPFGEIIKVPTGNRQIDLDRSFWPEVSERDRNRPLDQINSGTGPLKPGRDGSLLTADSNIAHAQFAIVYSVDDPIAFVRKLTVQIGAQTGDAGDFERSIVRAAVERGAVRVAAESSIDDILKRGSGDSDAGRSENSVESRIRQLAQRTLDEIGGDGLGLQISQVLLRRATPPFSVRREFNQVQIAQSDAGRVRDEALGEASTILNTVAGSANQPLIDLIERYEQALELEDGAQSEMLRQEIMNTLDGLNDTAPGQSSVTIAGTDYGNVRLSGEVAQMISAAKQYRQTVARAAQRTSETFVAKRAQYQANPAVFAMTEWTQAYREFLSHDGVELFWVPAGTEEITILITSDPELARQQERDRFRRDVENNPRLRELEGVNN